MRQPDLKQFGELTPMDFARQPVWVACCSADYEEPWFEDTDEETFRPWIGALPVSPSDGMFLVRATFEAADGSRFPGFVTPALEEGDMGAMQPQLFVGKRGFSFWGGMFGIDLSERQAFYQAIGKAPQSLFPLNFAADSNLAEGAVHGEIRGFYHRLDGDVIVET